MPTHTIGLTFKTDAGSVPLATNAYLIDSEINESFVIPASTVNHSIAVEFLFAKLVDYCFSVVAPATATLATVLNWNSASTPVPTMNVSSKAPQYFSPDLLTANLFTANITGLFVSNPNVVAVTLNIHIGMNDY